MPSTEPFKLTDWDAPKPPSPDFLMRWLNREGYQPQEELYPAGMHTPEMIFSHRTIRILLSGCVQVAFPGYGVIELNPGDRIDIEPNVLHDILVSSPTPATLFVANS